MEQQNEKIVCMNSEKYSIVYDKENRVYIPTDKNLQRISEQSFESACDAIVWCEDNWEGLV